MPKMTGCGKTLKAGNWVAERKGIVLCEECNARYKADWRVIYAVGQVADGVTVKCGQAASEAQVEEVSHGKAG